MIAASIIIIIFNALIDSINLQKLQNCSSSNPHVIFAQSNLYLQCTTYNKLHISDIA